MNITEEIQHLKRELVELIIKHLRENKIDITTAQKLARDFLLAMKEIKDRQDLLSTLHQLDGQYKEAGTLYVEELNKENNEKRDSVLSQMRILIQNGKLEEAIAHGHAFASKTQ